jgi:hypothetical protein
MLTILHLVPRLRIRGALPPLPHTTSRCITLLTTATILPLPLLLKQVQVLGSHGQWILATLLPYGLAQRELPCFLSSIFLLFPYIIRNVGNQASLLATFLPAGFLIGLFFNREDGSDMFFRNVC